MLMPKYLRNLDGTAGKPRLSEGTMLSEGPVNDCISRRGPKTYFQVDFAFAIVWGGPNTYNFSTSRNTT